MANRHRTRKRAARADYVRGDPVQPGPVTGGRLALEPTCLRFTGPEGDELRIELEELEGLTVSGSAGGRPTHGPRRAPRGTMFVAGLRHRQPTVWEFAIDRSAGAEFRERVNRGRTKTGHPPLPFVEALDEFPPLPVVLDYDPLESNGDGGDGYAVAPEVQVEDGTDGYPVAETEKEPKRDRRLVTVVGVVLAVLALEALVPLLIIRGI
jgi:hypothetical protein